MSRDRMRKRRRERRRALNQRSCIWSFIFFTIVFSSGSAVRASSVRTVRASVRTVQSAPSAAGDQSSTGGHRSAPARHERDRVAAIHERLLAAWAQQNPGKDPKKAAAWYRLLDQAKDEVAATQEGKRTRRATVRPGVLAWGDNS